MFWTFLFLLFGFFLLIKSAEILIDGAAGLAKRSGIPKIVIGLTLVAFGTSAPEATVSIVSAVQNISDIAVGNIIGSNIANTALIIGALCMLRTVPVLQTTFTRGLPLNILAILVLIVLGYDVFFQNNTVVFNRFSLGDGLILILFFIIFLYYVYGDFKFAGAMENEIVKKERKFFKNKLGILILMIVVGVIGLITGGNLVVKYAVELAAVFGLSQAVIGVTVVALGTSLPELVTSVVAVVKNEDDMAIGNIIGSNVFNIFLVLGVSSIIHPLDFAPKFLADLTFLFGITVLLFGLIGEKRQLTKRHGMMLLASYFMYLVFLALRESGIFLPG
jgi:cation:H+ antiporter